MMILPVYVEFVEAVSEIITNYYYWQKWKVVKKILKLKLPMNDLSFLFHFLQFQIHKKNHLYILLKFTEISF